MARSTATQAFHAKAGVAARQFKNFLNSKKKFKNEGIYPARDFVHRCKPVPPDVFFP
jgi:hypothetical protein